MRGKFSPARIIFVFFLFLVATAVYQSTFPASEGIASDNKKSETKHQSQTSVSTAPDRIVVLRAGEHSGADVVWKSRKYYGKNTWGVRGSKKVEEGQIWFNSFPGASGKYRVELAAVLEQDGRPEFELRQNDQTIFKGQYPYLKGTLDCKAKGAAGVIPLGELDIVYGSKIALWARSVYECNPEQGAYALWYEIRFVPLTSNVVSFNTSKAPQCEKLIETPVRGLGCLHCLHPNAREQAQVITNLIVESCLKNIATNYLVDGTFGWDEPFFRQEIEKLTSGGRELSLYLYTLNGPWQRSSKEARQYSDLYSIMGPGTFRDRIMNDPDLQETARKSLAHLRSAVDYAVKRGAKVHITVGLEDNLTIDAFQKFLEIVRSNLPEGAAVRFGRNSTGREVGNDHIIPDGFYVEKHINRGTEVTISNGMVSNDGDFFPLEQLVAGSKPTRVVALRDNSSANGNAFILWVAKFQGLQKGKKLEYGDPNKRTYHLPTEYEARAILQFLRG